MNHKAGRIAGAFCDSQVFLEGFPPRNCLKLSVGCVAPSQLWSHGGTCAVARSSSDACSSRLVQKEFVRFLQELVCHRSRFPCTEPRYAQSRFPSFCRCSFSVLPLLETFPRLHLWSWNLHLALARWRFAFVSGAEARF